MTDYCEYKIEGAAGSGEMLVETGCHENTAFVQHYDEDGVYVPADRVEEVCAALREAAGLPPVWTVEKVAHDEAYGEKINASNGIDSTPVTYSLTPTGARGYAAQLLAAADEAEARANRPKLPTAADSVIKCDGDVFVRMVNGLWLSPKQPGTKCGPLWFARKDFTVLYDAGAEQ